MAGFQATCPEKQTAITAWATRGLPARVDANTTAKLLGFAEHDIQILMRTGKLNPLGDPAPNAPKWFSAVERKTADHYLVGCSFGYILVPWLAERNFFT